MADKDNVLQFPKLVSDPPMTAAEVKDKISAYKENYANDLAEIIWENVLHEMARANCDFDSDMEKYFPNMILIFEAIKALHLQTLDVEHPLQEFALNNVVVFESDGVNTVGGLKTNLTDTGVDNDDEV
tara:strand:- start:51 stop:434 length:384 start_codon:yes stop_codon:yes gene_type:complete